MWVSPYGATAFRVLMGTRRLLMVSEALKQLNDPAAVGFGFALEREAAKFSNLAEQAKVEKQRADLKRDMMAARRSDRFYDLMA